MTLRIFESQILYYIITFFILHTAFYCLEHIHYKYCVPRGVSGFFQSMITSNSSPCVTIRWVSTHISSTSIGIISLIGALAVSKFVSHAPPNILGTSTHNTIDTPSKKYEEAKKENELDNIV